MWDTNSRQVISTLGLVASDFAYKSQFSLKPGGMPIVGEVLSSFPDSSPSNEQGFPQGLLFPLANQPLAAYQYVNSGPNGIGVVKFLDWELLTVIEFQGDGFGAVIFKSKSQNAAGKFEYIVAMRGTDGTDAIDWWQNLDLSRTVWGNHQPQILAALFDGQGLPQSVRPADGIVHFTGQSLGGGLAQYAAYEYARQLQTRDEFDSSKLTLTTFNAFGGVRGLLDIDPGFVLNKSIFDNVRTAHYVIQNDLVHRLGAGAPEALNMVGGSWHLNGQGNTYLFSFQRYQNGVPVTAENRFLNPVDAHRIEAGFYRGFENHGQSFTSVQGTHTISYIDSATSQSATAYFSRKWSNASEPRHPRAQLVIGILGGALFGDSAELKGAIQEVNSAADRSDWRDVARGIPVFAALVGASLFRATARSPQALGVGAGVVLSNLLSRLLDGVPNKGTIYDEINFLLPSDRQRPSLKLGLFDAEPESIRTARLNFATLLAVSSVDEVYVQYLSDPLYGRMASLVRGTQPDMQVLVDANTSEGNTWLGATLRNLSQSAEQTGMGANALVRFEVSLLSFLNEQKKLASDSDSAFTILAVQTANEFIVNDFAKALANANRDFTDKYADAGTSLFTNRVLDFVDYAPYERALQQAISDPEFWEIKSLLQTAIGIVDQAGETIVIVQGRPQNPFDDPVFDPDVSPVAVGAIKEGQVKTFSVFLPYEAQEGGQHISLQLAGTVAGKFKVLLEADEIDLSEDGEFDFLIVEGSRSITFGLWAQEDVDTDETLSLSATLVDGNGEPTHQTHLELNLALDATEEGVLPVTTNTILGDRQFPNQEDVLNDTAANDRIEALGGDDTVTAFAGGDDHIFGGDGNDALSAGDGNDVVEGGPGSDNINGGLGDDQLFADTFTTWEGALVAGETAGGSSRGDLLAGEDGHDFVIGGSERDFLTGGEGDDRIAGGAGNDIIESDVTVASAGPNWSAMVAVTGNVYSVVHTDMTLGAAGAGADVVYAGGGDDYVDAGPGDDTVDTGSGNDVAFGGAGSDTVFGRDGNDVLIGDNPGVVATGDEGGDYLDGGAGDDILQGNGGDDILIGGTDSDTLSGGAGKDIYVFNRGDVADIVFDDSTGAEASVMVFGKGFDPSALTIRPGSLILDFGGGDAIHLASFDVYNPNSANAFERLNFADGSSMSFKEVMALGFDFDGTEENDDAHDAGHPILIGTAFDDRIRGYGGNDTLIGLQGNDTLDSGAGHDQLFGDEGNDILKGGTGSDRLIGGDGDDQLYAGDDRDALWGGKGNDYLEGGGGEDWLFGELGDDTYVFDEQDTVVDFLGATTIAFTGDEGPEDIELRQLIVNTLPVFAIKKAPEAGGDPFAFGMGLTLSSADQLAGMTFADGTVLSREEMLHATLMEGRRIVGGEGDDQLTGYAGGDGLIGGGGNDTLLGLRADDFLEGDAGDDWLDGGSGNDELFGGAGNDTLTGGTGDDSLFGEDGSDIYIYARGDGHDVIADGGDTAETDVLRLGDILREEVSIAHEASGDLKVTLNGSSDSITVSDYYDVPANRIERIEFADGSVVDFSFLDALTVPPIVGTDGADILIGTAFDDTLLGLDGDDAINGGFGSDTLEGGAGDDQLNGGGGNDELIGGPGIDTYLLNLLPGNATLVEDNSENSIIRIAGGLRFADLDAQRSGDDLVLSVRDSQSSVTVPDYYNGRTNWTVTTAAGGSKSLADLIVYLEQIARPPQTVQDLEQDYLDDAHRQYQIYLASFGASGDIRVNEQPFSDAATIFRNPPFDETEENGLIFLNIAQITAGGSANVLDFRHSGVVIADAGAGDDLIDNQGFAFDNGSPFVSIGSFLIGNDGDDKILGTWEADTLIGGAGNDYIAGSDGNDTYLIFGADSGTDIIDEVIPEVNLPGGHFAFAGAKDSTDTLEIVGVNYEDVTFSKGSYNASLVGGTGVYTTFDISWGTDRHVRVILPNPNDPYLTLYPGESVGIEFTKFADGTVLTLNDLLTLAPSLPSAIIGGDRADTIVGTTGNDVIYGEGGNDSITDIAGQNFLNGGPGNDALTGGTGPDTLDGGPGDDSLNGFLGFDTFLFGYGGGSDAIVDIVLPFPLPDIDTLQFLPGVQPGDVTTRRTGADLVFRLNDSLDQITVKNWFTLPENQLDRVTFVDGTVWSVDGIFGQLPVSVITGTANNDVLAGTRGRNEIYGLGGNDTLTGRNNPDVLDGGSGDDQLSGGLENDTLIGGTGNDLLIGGEGSDLYRFYLGDGRDSINESDSSAPADTDTLRFGPGILPDDITIALDSDLHIRINGTSDEVSILDWGGGGGSHKVERIEFADGTVWGPADIDAHTPGPQINSSGANDVVVGTGLSDTIQGGQGDQWLNGGSGNDTLVGGPGNDLLFGGPGSDTYVFNAGDGVDTIYDPSTPAESNAVVFGDGITPDSLSLGLGSLLVRVGDGDDAIHFQSFDPENPYATRDVDVFRFADGSTLSYEQLLARGFDIFGTAGDDELRGTVLTDRMSALAGGDVLDAGAGDDVLDGGSGSDILAGGPGNDTYLFGLSSGSDFIEDSAGDLDAVLLGEGITPENVRISRSGSVISLQVNGTTDELLLHQEPGTGFQIERVQFADGTAWDAATLESKVVAENTAPVVVAPLTDQSALEDAVFTLALPSGTFSDADAGDELVFTATREDGAPLPEWLTFNAATQTFTGTPTNNDVGSFDITVTATDQGGLSVSDVFNLTVQNVNDAPLLAVPIPDQTALEDASFSFTLASNTFTDVDVGDAITLSASVGGGGALSAWLTFDSATGTFSGTPANDDVGTLSVEVTATDRAGATATGTFSLAIENANDAPTLANPLPDQSGNQNALFQFVVPEGTFADVDAGDVLTLSAALADGSALPAWLGFDPLTLAFSGTPSEFDMGDVDIGVTATDLAGASVSDAFSLSISDASTLNETYLGTLHGDAIVTGFANDLIDAGGGDDLVQSGAGRDIVFGGQGDDLIFGEAGNDRLYGGKGKDWLDGGAGDDLLAGGAGHDTIATGDGDNLVIGGAGHDTISGGAGRDVVMVNLNDGKDVLQLFGAAIGGNEDVLSLGGGIAARDLYLRRNDGELIVEARGADESEEAARVILSGWYGDADHQTVTTLQLFEGDRASTYDFKALVARFDAATQEQSNAGPWSAAEALPEVLMTSGGKPIGGAIAQEYANSGTVLGDMPPAAEETQENAVLFGGDPAESAPLPESNDPVEEPSDQNHDEDDHRVSDGSRSVAALLEAYLAERPRYDFEVFALQLERSDRQGEALNAQEIARRWQTIARYVNGLSDEHDEDARGSAVFSFNELGLLGGGAFGGGFGHDSSTGVIRGAANLRTLQGLEEGFDHLRP